MTDLQAEGLRIAEALQGAEKLSDPIGRYRALDAAHDQVVALAAAIRNVQGEALGELRPAPWQEIADAAGIRSWQYAQKLVNNAARAAQREERT
jgi:hypothetical protein